jgi:hypothetical protein
VQTDDGEPAVAAPRALAQTGVDAHRSLEVALQVRAGHPVLREPGGVAMGGVRLPPLRRTAGDQQAAS